MKSEQISEFLRTRISERDFPSAVYLVAEKGEIIFQDALGFAVAEPEKIEARIDTIYDLASLTKVLVTGLLCAKLIENGEINLQDKISKFFPNFDTDEKKEITIQNLLTHTSGFKKWLPFYLISDSLFQISNVIADEKLENSIDSKVVYSDLNFLMLGFLIRKKFKKHLRQIFEREIAKPLELTRTFFGELKTLRREIAASEKGNQHEKQTCIEQGYDVSGYDWRDYRIWGEVHDGNCFYLGGVSGHAGLFSTAEETFKIAQQFLAKRSVLLKPKTCALFRTNFTSGLNEARSIAFQLAETPESTASNALAKDGFGHLGFTGTSLWIEPESERIFILLTNRTHAHELPFVNINSVRRKFHELATAELNENAKI